MDVAEPAAGATKVRVWDLLVRLCHWILVVAFFVAYFTEDDVLTLHVWAGYTVGVVVLLRVLWSFVGPRHARFTDFLYRPRTVIDYSARLLTLRPPRRYLGHSPAGGAMAVALLLGLAATVGVGLVFYAVEENAGPLAPFVAAAPGSDSATRDSGREERGDEEDEDENGEAGEVWEELHEVLANLTLYLVLVHIAGVILASLVHRENLVRAMITGDKLSEPGER